VGKILRVLILITFLTNYIFTLEDFTAFNLPIFVNNVKADAPPPLLAMDGATVLVPFKVAPMSGVYLEWMLPGGGVSFGFDDAGSGTSMWAVGEPFVWGIGWRVALCSPPIIVGDIIYVPLLSAFNEAAPFVVARISDDAIHIYNRY